MSTKMPRISSSCLADLLVVSCYLRRRTPLREATHSLRRVNIETQDELAEFHKALAPTGLNELIACFLGA